MISFSFMIIILWKIPWAGLFIYFYWNLCIFHNLVIKYKENSYNTFRTPELCESERGWISFAFFEVDKNEDKRREFTLIELGDDHTVWTTPSSQNVADESHTWPRWQLELCNYCSSGRLTGQWHNSRCHCALLQPVMRLTEHRITVNCVLPSSLIKPLTSSSPYSFLTFTDSFFLRSPLCRTMHRNAQRSNSNP